MKGCCMRNMFIVACIVMIVLLGDQLWHIQMVRGTVSEKETVGQDTIRKEYIVKIQDDNGVTRVLSIKNLWIVGKFDATKIYDGIRVGSYYRFYTIGADNNIRLCD